MKNILKLFLLMLTVNSVLLYGQKSKSRYRNLQSVSKYILVSDNDTIKPYYISKNPITNIEYIIYLCWIADVYGDQPEALLKAFPGLNERFIDSTLTKNFQIDQFRSLINSINLTRDYIFNSKYLDYPIIGITNEQAMTFCNWLSDRYNEYILIKKSFLNFQLYSRNEYCFNTEAYLADQYEGIISHLVIDPVTSQERSVKWQDRVLFPSFRLPSKYELKLVGNLIEKSFIPYKNNRFLNTWMKYYISIKGSTFTLNLGKNKNLSIEIASNEIFQIPKSNLAELFLDSKLPECESNIIEIFAKYKQPVITPVQDKEICPKNSFGHMPYILISEDSNLNPIYIQRKA